MKRLQRAAVLCLLADEMKARGSWCGETHLQKASYLLQEALDVPLGVDFILYKHGPFSFELRDELVSLRADGLFRLVPQGYPYGPKLVVTERGHELEKRFPKTLGNYRRTIEWVAEHLSDKNVTDLERLATSLYVKTEEGVTDEDAIATRVTELKPHVERDQAVAAVRELEAMLEDAP
jgi:uncharacterized protein YwgA